MERSNNSRILLYEKLIHDIEYDINTGVYSEGSQLPTELDLASKYEVSRITVRRAIKELIQMGYLEIVRGKGTFVKNNILDLHILNLAGFSELDKFDNRKVKKSIILKKYIMDEELNNVFGMDGNQSYLKLKRIIYDNEKPFSIDISYFPETIYPRIQDRIDCNTSILNLIQQDYNIDFKHCEKSITIITDPNIAKKLDLLSTDPLYFICKKIIDKNKKVVYYSTYYLIAKQIKFNLVCDI